VNAALAANPSPASIGSAAAGRLFVLDLSGSRVLLMNSDGSDRKVIVTDCVHPDGIVVDAEAGHIYWTNIGVPNLNDGSIERADIDGRNRKIIVPRGGTFTPKQLHIDKKNRRLYWSDREGMRVMRAKLDGSAIEILVETGQGDDAAATRRGGALALRSIPNACKSIGPKKDRTMRVSAASAARTSKYRKARLPPTAPISSCCLTGCPSRLIWSSISPIASSIGPTVATLRAATL
jgi:hypothetical protein